MFMCKIRYSLNMNITIHCHDNNVASNSAWMSNDGATSHNILHYICVFLYMNWGND